MQSRRPVRVVETASPKPL